MRQWPRETEIERLGKHAFGVCLYVGTLMCLRARGIQPFASGKGRHDEVMLTVCYRRSEIFLTRFCFCFFIQIPRPIHQFSNSR